MNDLKLGALSIPITQFASQGNAVLGIRDSGKTYSATYLAERLLKAGIPFIAFDPSGVWKFLRVPGAGAGFPVVVAGGKNPDLPLTPSSAPEIVRAAMRSNVSLVVDLYDIHISKADWSRIVESCVRVLLYENGEHGLRHVFIEEAAEFAPQNVQGDKARVYAEVEKLARIGGNALLGYTLINQRAEQVNKAVLELCDCLFLHRQKGKNSLTSLSKWLEYSQGGETKDIIRSLPTLPSGECWIWPANADHASHVKMPQKQSFHPDRRALIANPAAASAQRVDAGKFVEQLRGTLDKYLKEAEANDPAALKKRVADLERQIAAKGGGASKAEVEAARKSGHDAGFAQGHEKAAAVFRKHITAMEAWLARAPRMGDVPAIAAPPAVPVSPPRAPAAPRIPQPAHHHGNGACAASLSAAARKILQVLSQFPDGCTAGKLALLTGYRYSGGFRNSLSELRTKGLLAGENTGVMRMTDAGEAYGPFDPLPSGEALQDYWLRHPSFGKCSRDVLAELLKHPGGRSAEQLAAATDYEYSGGFRNALSELRTAGVLVGKNTEIMRASEELLS